MPPKAIVKSRLTSASAATSSTKTKSKEEKGKNSKVVEMIKKRMEETRLREEEQRREEEALKLEQERLEREEEEKRRVEEEKARQKRQDQSRQQRQGQLSVKQKKELERKRQALGITQRGEDGTYRISKSYLHDKNEREKEKVKQEELKQEELKREQEIHHHTKYVDHHLRSPICCVLGHVDTGKTKLLDYIRSSHVQSGEASGITQQIGATFIPIDKILEATEIIASEKKEVEVNIPGLLTIDTPGHESFHNLRSRGASMCDIAILVVDLMHGLEPQTKESIELLKRSHIPFVVALNKIDCLTGWNRDKELDLKKGVKEIIAGQASFTGNDFDNRVKEVKLQFAIEGLNSEVYYKNREPKKVISMVPVSAKTGEGVSDLLYVIAKLTQTFLETKIQDKTDVFNCIVMEVKTTEGFGHTVDTILVNGSLKEGDKIVACTMNGPIVTPVRILLTPKPLTEMRVRSQYQHHKEVHAAMGVRVVAPNLEHVVPGSRLCLAKDGISQTELDLLRKEVMADFNNLNLNLNEEYGVYVVANTIGALEALLNYLHEVKIPVIGVALGTPKKADIIKASSSLGTCHKQYALLMSFAVKIPVEMEEFAEKNKVKTFYSETIYKLVEEVQHHFEKVEEAAKLERGGEVVFPCELKILPDCIFATKNPIIIGVEVTRGLLYPSTPVVAVRGGDGSEDRSIVNLGVITEIQLNKKVIEMAKPGEKVAIRIEGRDGDSNIMYDRHFNSKSVLCSRLSRESIDVLKQYYRKEMEEGGGMDNWRLVRELKSILNVV